MNESIKNRAAAIRDYVSKSYSPDPNDLYKVNRQLVAMGFLLGHSRIAASL